MDIQLNLRPSVFLSRLLRLFSSQYSKMILNKIIFTSTLAVPRYFFPKNFIYLFISKRYAFR